MHAILQYLMVIRLKQVGGDIRSELSGVYFDGILGLDKVTRFYVGQSGNLRTRIAQHMNFRHRRDNPSLHYHAFQKSIYNVFGILAIVPPLSMGNHALPGMDRPNLLLNVLEMWMAMIFRSLPKQVLEPWSLPKTENERMFGALNISSPLDHGAKEREWVDLSKCNDHLVREYLGPVKQIGNSDISQPQLEKVSLETESAVQSTSKGFGDYVIHVNAQALLLTAGAVLIGFALTKATLGANKPVHITRTHSGCDQFYLHAMVCCRFNC
jgi:hypothetical protein